MRALRACGQDVGLGEVLDRVEPGPQNLLQREPGHDRAADHQQSKCPVPPPEGHLPARDIHGSAGKIGAFKVTTIAGAYWKNDSTRPQLQRLYGTAFFNQKDLDAYLTRIEEAKKRDHRVLGKQLKLFTISQMVGSGLILWMPKGATVRGILESFIKDELLKRGYSPVYTPHRQTELYRLAFPVPMRGSRRYHRPAAGTLDLCQYRLAMGEIDDKRGTIQEYEAAHLPPQYSRKSQAGSSNGSRVR